MGECWDTYLSNEERMIEKIAQERINAIPFCTAEEARKARDQVLSEFFLHTGRMPEKLEMH